jgi:hypothetical protein
MGRLRGREKNVPSTDGLREMARLRSDRVSVPAEAGEGVRGLWKVSTPPTERHAAFNAWMLDWLDRCAQAEWLTSSQCHPPGGRSSGESGESEGDRQIDFSGSASCAD